MTTTVLLFVSAEEPAVAVLNDYVEHSCGAPPLVLNSQVDAAWGGSKWPECSVYAAGWPDDVADGVTDVLPAFPWREPHVLQLFLKRDSDKAFRILMERNGHMADVSSRGIDPGTRPPLAAVAGACCSPIRWESHAPPAPPAGYLPEPRQVSDAALARAADALTALLGPRGAAELGLILLAGSPDVVPVRLGADLIQRGPSLGGCLPGPLALLARLPGIGVAPSLPGHSIDDRYLLETGYWDPRPLDGVSAAGWLADRLSATPDAATVRIAELVARFIRDQGNVNAALLLERRLPSARDRDAAASPKEGPCLG